MTSDRRRTISDLTRNRILELAFSGKSAAEIWRILQVEGDGIGESALPGFNLNVPDVRTVQRIMRPARLRATREDKWSLKNNPTGLDSRIVMDTLGEVIVGTEGRVSSFTLDQAAWLVHIREGTQGLSGWGAWVLYKLCVEGDEYEISGLDVVLALRPWESSERTSSLQNLINSRAIPEPVCWGFIKENSELMAKGKFASEER